MKFCPNCGAKNDNPSALFCSNCGFGFPPPEDKRGSAAATPPVEAASMEGGQAAGVPPPRSQPAKQGNSLPTEDTLVAAPSGLPKASAISSVRPKPPLPLGAEKMEEDIFIIPKGAGARVSPRGGDSASRPSAQFSTLFEEEGEEEAALFPSQEPQEQPERQDILPVRPREDSPQPEYLREVAPEQAAAPRPAQGDDLKPAARQPASPNRPQREIHRPAQPIQRKEELISSKVAAIEQQINERETAELQGRQQRPSAQGGRPAQGQSLEELYATQNQREGEGTSEAVPVRPARPVQHPVAQHPAAERSPAERRAGEPTHRPRPKKVRQPRHPEPVYDNDEDEYEENPKKGFVKWIVLGLVAIALVVGGFFGFRALTAKPQDTIDAFVTAVQAKDIETLKKITRLDNLTDAADANWLALCNGLAAPEQLERLKAQFQQQIDAPKMIGADFPAVRLATQTSLGIFKKYTVAVTGITVTVPKAAAGTVLRLDSMEYQGAPSGEGQAYTSVMPGSYTVQLVGADGGATDPTPMSIFTNIQWDAQPPAGNTGGGEGETGEPEQPADSAPPESSVPESKVPEGPSLSEADANALIGDYYASYLECINQQKLDPLRKSTETMRNSVAERIKRPGNQQNTFEYVSATCAASTFKTGEANALATLTFTANFKYKYKPREGEGKQETSENKQTVELVYSNGSWLVNKVE